MAFRYAITHGKVRRNPAVDIRSSDVLKARKVVKHAGVDATELPQLLRKNEAYKGKPTTRLVLKLMALAFMRTSELMEARWAESDLKVTRWDIPAE